MANNHYIYAPTVAISVNRLYKFWLGLKNITSKIEDVLD